MKIERINPAQHWSQIVIRGWSGLLARAGTDKTKLLTAQIWLRDINDWSNMNEVWDAWIAPGNAPTRATVEAKLASPDLLVEIMVQAAR